jgi:hypothetical protein
MPTRKQLLRSIHLWLAVFIAGLLLSGITAFPLVHELALLTRIDDALHLGEHAPALNNWLLRVQQALAENSVRYPFLAYGTDWLAFGHFVIAAAFIGVWRDPIRNRWLIIWGLIACAAVIPFALSFGPARGIPVYWSLIDCSFGVLGCIPLLLIRHKIRQLESHPA